MAGIHGGEWAMRTLRLAGVDTLFTLPGGQAVYLLDGTVGERIRVIDVRHEQQAVHMADGYARAARKLGVALVAGSPGVVNAIPAIQVAYEAQVPVLILAGLGSMAGREIGVMQHLDQVGLVKPITKWAATCYEARRIPEYVSTAVRQALSGRPGPVFLDFPQDILAQVVEESEIVQPGAYRTEARAYGDPALVKQAVEMLMAAERPIIIAGSGCWWSRADEALLAFAEASSIPVLTRNQARGLVPDDHPLGLGFLPMAAAGADAYLVIGTRLDWTVGYGRPPLFDPKAKVIRVDIAGEEIGKNRSVDLGIVGDARAVLEQMLDVLPAAAGRRRHGPDWAARAKATLAGLRQQAAPVADSGAVPMHSLALSKRLERALDASAVKVIDGGYIAAFAMQMMDARRPGGIVWVGSTGHLGVGLAYAISAKLAQPDRPVVAVMGDGAFGLCAMEFDTAVRHGVPIVVVIANDSGWGEMRSGQKRRFGPDRSVAMELAPTRYDELARALGGVGEEVERPEDVEPAVQRALAAGRPAIVNVRIDRDQGGGIVGGLPWIVD